MKIQYVADDGTIFFDAEKCVTYEYGKVLKECHIKKSRFWTDNKKPMSIEEFCSNPRNCDFIEVAAGEEEAIYYIFDEEGVIDPWDGCRAKPGRYYYSQENDEWCDYEVIEEEYLKAREVFQGE